MNKKLILVTGATRGLGLSIAKDLHSKGYRVIATGRSLTDELEILLDDNLIFKKFDLSDLGSIKTFIKEIVKDYGRLFGLVNNAAIGGDGVLSTMHESDISNVIKVNVEAPILLAKYASRSMLINQTGRVVNISSIIASTGYSGLSVYGASKSAMIGFTKSLSRELGKLGITVNSVSPGYMQTDMTAGLEGKKLESIVRRSPMRKLPETDDVAYTVSFLLSDEAKMINGTNITVDAGSTA